MNDRMHRWLAGSIALLLLIGGGLVHGLRADRWRPSPELAEALTKVDEVPLEIGDWIGEALPGDQESFTRAGAQAWWVRQYRPRRGGEPVLVVLMCGRAGRMAVHTPEVCYQGAGYELYETPTLTRLPGANEALGEFLTARFVKSAGRSSDLRLYWAWNDGGRWQAPRNPRWEFRGRPFLYKLYVSHGTGASRGGNDAAVDFLNVLAPELRATLLQLQT